MYDINYMFVSVCMYCKCVYMWVYVWDMCSYGNCVAMETNGMEFITINCNVVW